MMVIRLLIDLAYFCFETFVAEKEKIVRTSVLVE